MLSLRLSLGTASPFSVAAILHWPRTFAQTQREGVELKQPEAFEAGNLPGNKPQADPMWRSTMIRAGAPEKGKSSNCRKDENDTSADRGKPLLASDGRTQMLNVPAIVGGSSAFGEKRCRCACKAIEDVKIETGSVTNAHPSGRPSAWGVKASVIRRWKQPKC